MKNITLMILSLLFSWSVTAEEPSCTVQVGESEVKEQLEIKTDVPNYLKGATITVRLKDGRESQVPAEKFKVVPRKQQFIVTRTEQATLERCVTNQPRKNRASLVGGYGAQGGLKTTTSGTTVEVESRTGPTGGAQYQRMINDRFSVGVQGQTNKTGSVLFGVDF